MQNNSNNDIHKYSEKLEIYLKKIKSNSEISESNKKTLLEFQRLFLSSKAVPTQWKNMQCLYVFSKQMKKEFKKAKRQDLEEWAASLDNKKNLESATKIKYKTIIKRFYGWLYGCARHSYPEQVQRIQISKNASQRTLPEGLLKPEDIQRMLNLAGNARDKAAIAMLFDSGARIGDLFSANISHIEDCQDSETGLRYLSVHLPKGKTGARILPLINCRPYVLKWLEEHPNKQNKESPLFVNLMPGHTQERMEYKAIWKVLKLLQRKLKLEKHVNPHSFRHSAATIYAKYMRESVLDSWFGWGTQKISSVYVSLSGKDLLEQYLKFYNSKENILRIITCPNCKKENSGAVEYCDCGTPLIAKTLITNAEKMQGKADALMNILYQDADFRKLLIEKILSKKLEEKLSLLE